jgi:hypothetical protein
MGGILSSEDGKESSLGIVRFFQNARAGRAPGMPLRPLCARTRRSRRRYGPRRALYSPSVARIFDQTCAGYDELVNAIIRPPRCE